MLLLETGIHSFSCLSFEFLFLRFFKSENQHIMAYNLLKGKKGIIFGALNDQSIAWKVAQRAVEEGAEIVLSNALIALRMGELNKLAEECNAPVIAADVTNGDDINNLLT